MRKMAALLIAVASLFVVSLSALAATVYISDELTVPLRRGPSNNHKIIHAGLPSGMALEVLGEDSTAGFTHVRTPNGADGWVPTQYLSGQPIAKDRLTAANRRVESLEATSLHARPGEDRRRVRTRQGRAPVLAGRAAVVDEDGGGFFVSVNRDDNGEPMFSEARMIRADQSILSQACRPQLFLHRLHQLRDHARATGVSTASPTN